ncbi:MAG: hypothetical protein P9L96_01490 [Candidatus Gygaella obscura]|nr:hypothetical protein [Candidatus Gygaella obscura]
MSLIYDALRKAQGELQNPVGTQDVNPSQQEKPVKEIKKAKINKYFYIILAVLLLVFLIKSNFSILKEKFSKTKEYKIEKIVEKFIPLPGPSFKQGLFLSGIVLGNAPEDNIAIINDVIVKQGDIIEGVTVLDISTLQVELQKDGENLLLELE